MKDLLLSMLCLPFAAFATTVPPLPAGEFADTEVSTNIPVAVDTRLINRLEFTLSLVPSPSNCVEIAIGSDADRNGVLSSDEADYTFGCDCGRWFLRDTGKDRVVVEGGGDERDASSSRSERIFTLKRREIHADWNLIKVTRRGFGERNEAVEIRERSIGFTLWLR